MKLFYAPKTRAGRVRWLLEELGVPYELHRLDLARGEHRTPEYLAVHPLGRVPALADGEHHLIESAAICMYLADKYIDRGLAPRLDSPSRGAYYQWIIYAMAEIESALIAALLDEKAKPRVAEVFAPVDRALEGRQFLIDDTFSAADVIMGGICSWARFSGLLDGYPRLIEYSKRLGDRPASRRARAD